MEFAGTAALCHLIYVLSARSERSKKRQLNQVDPR